MLSFNFILKDCSIKILLIGIYSQMIPDQFSHGSLLIIPYVVLSTNYTILFRKKTLLNTHPYFVIWSLLVNFYLFFYLFNDAGLVHSRRLIFFSQRNPLNPISHNVFHESQSESEILKILEFPLFSSSFLLSLPFFFSFKVVNVSYFCFHEFFACWSEGFLRDIFDPVMDHFA